MKIYRISEDISYRITHTAPDRASGAPMHNVTDIYPDDIYSANAIRYYGDGVPYDSLSIYIIQSAKGKPNNSIKIYRAVPYDKDKKKEANEIRKTISYFNKFEFFPVGDEIVNSVREKLGEMDYNLQKKLVYEQLLIKAQEIEDSIEAIRGINDGDWVSISREYAKTHGLAMFGDNHKILSKTVKAMNLYTDGNSIHEWGYWS
jgi:hypothetical protein